MKALKKFGLSLLLLLPIFAHAQEAEMADVMRSNGKIYVVVGVVVLIFIILFAYLISLDLKIKKLERSQKL